MSYVEFNDGSLVTLSNGLPAPGNRFLNWAPKPVVVGPRHHALGTGIPYVYKHALVHTVTFVLAEFPQSKLADLLRFKAHLDNGGSFTLYTEDAAARTYPNCYLAEGGSVDLSDPDPVELLRTLTATVMNAAGTPFLCLF